MVMHSSNGPGPRHQDVWLPVPPDLPHDSFPLLQPASLLQLLSRGEHVDAPQSAVGLAATIAHGSRGHFRDVHVLFILCDALILLFGTGLLQLFPLGGGEGSAAALSPAGDGGHHEAERHEQTKADAHHEEKGEALWVGCVIRATASTTENSVTPSL